MILAILAENKEAIFTAFINALKVAGLLSVPLMTLHFIYRTIRRHYDYDIVRGVSIGEPLGRSQIQTAEDAKINTLQNQGRTAIQKMRAINAAIPDKKITEQINDIEQSTDGILNHLKETPERMSQASKFFSYYLPTAVQLLETYHRLYSIQNPGPNVRQAKEKIQGMLDDIVKTFRSQLDTLFAEDIMDVDTDIAVFRQMMAQDGMGYLKTPTGKEEVK